MDKKHRLQIKRDESLAAIDDELDGALESLEKANARIGDLLATIEDAGPEAVTSGETVARPEFDSDDAGPEASAVPDERTEDA